MRLVLLRAVCALLWCVHVSCVVYWLVCVRVIGVLCGLSVGVTVLWLFVCMCVCLCVGLVFGVFGRLCCCVLCNVVSWCVCLVVWCELDWFGL